MNMEIKKPNDILVATLSNPELTSYDLLSHNITGENTSLLSKEEYKNSTFVQDKFKDNDGNFDNVAFEEVYNLAQSKYQGLTDKEYLSELDKMEYSPFDITRPKFAKTFNVSAQIEKEYNPFEVRKGWSGFGSINESPLSLREIAQKNKIYDPDTDTWSEQSVNDLSLYDKLIGDTLVYGQYDEDGMHFDKHIGSMAKHKKGDWKVDDNGNLFLEKLGDRSVYGKQVLNPMDTLTTDGSLVNQYDFFDSDGREKSIAGTVFKLAAEIAPTFIPGAGTVYGGIRAAVALTSVLPTFYKSIEGIILGEKESSLTKSATELENYMAKFTASSVSDEGSQSLFNFEQVGKMTADIFTQIYEQRAMASLSKMIMKGDQLADKKTLELANKIQGDLFKEAIKGKISLDDVPTLSKAAMEKIPELKSIMEKQSQLSKALSLGYMSLISTSDIYGEAINNGYDKRTAGIAALLTAAGQYSVMMNNEMGTWFLDKTTGYNTSTNRVLVRKAVLPWLDDIKESLSVKDATEAKKSLVATVKSIKNSISDIFTTPSVLGEAMWKNAIVEGVEEVTEQAVQDTTEGIIDALSYFGVFDKKEGARGFGGWSNVFSKEGAQAYLANLVGGVIGGGMFEFQRSKIDPILNPHNLPTDVQKSLYELVAGGQKADIIKEINKNRSRLGNQYLTPVNPDGTIQEKTETNGISQADLVADRAIEMIDLIDGIINSHGLGKSDEEIINKAIRDKIIIDKLKKATPEGSRIGLEGLVLEDYKTKMSKIVNLESKIRSLSINPENEESSVKANESTIKSLKDELKLYVNDVNDILEGKYGSKYFLQASMYLNSKVHKPFIHANKNDYVKAKYKVNYSDLAADGSGAELSQKRMDEEWDKYINSTDLKADLETASNVYLYLEQMLNPSIAEYVESGYSEEHKKTVDNILDLKGTIDLFNTAKDAKTKNQLLEHFIKINNELSKSKLEIVAPWDVMQGDMYDQLNNIGLVKKVSYNVDNNNIVEELSDFTPDELKETIGESNVTRGDQNKFYIQEFFKQFPINPMNAESVIFQFNNNISVNNRNVLQQIAKLEAKPDKTESDLTEIEKLKSSMINIKLDSYRNVPQIRGLINIANQDSTVLLENKNITFEQLEEYKNLQNSKNSYKESFDELVTKHGSDNWHNLSAETLNALIEELDSSGIYDLSISKLSASSENALSVIGEAIVKLKNGNLTEEEFIQVKNTLTPLMDIAKNLLSKGRDIIDNTDLLEVNREIDEINKKLENDIEAVKPEILKLHNYAFEVALKALESGSADKEVFNLAEKLYNEDKKLIQAEVFPELPNIKLEELVEIFENYKIYQQRLTESQEDYEGGDFEAFHSMSKLSDILKSDKQSILTNPESGSILVNQKFMKFLEINFDNNMSLGMILSKLSDSLTRYKNKQNDIKRLNQFTDLATKGLKLKSNALYDFIRNFTLTLNSNPNNKTAKIFEILSNEETILRSTSNITNYTSDGIREQDLQQAIDQLEMIKAVVYAMSTTTVDFEDPIGFIASRQKYAQDNKLEDDVLKLKTITSDVASLMVQDLDAVIAKLQFLQDLSKFNAGKMMNEQEIIRGRVEEILLDNWKVWCTKMNPSFLLPDKIKEILASNESSSKKLMKIENLIFDTNVNRKDEVFKDFLKHLSMVDSDKPSQIDKEVKYLNSWDLAVYLGTVLATRSEDFHVRSFLTVNSEFPRAPFFTQEFGARVLKASTVNPELFSKIFELHPNSNKVVADFITMVTGGAGTGKTSSEFGLFLDNVRQTNESTDAWLVAPADLQVKNLQSAIDGTIGKDKITTSSKMKSELFEKLGISNLLNTIQSEIEHLLDDSFEKKYVKLVNTKITFTEELTNNEWISEIASNLQNLPNLLLIDEVTHFSFAELYVLNAISKYSYFNDSLNFMKIIAAGDPTQLGYLAEINGNFYSYNIDSVNAIFTPRLWATVRASNNQKRVNNDRLVRIVDRIKNIYTDNRDNYDSAKKESQTYLENTKELNSLSYYEKPDALSGDKIVNKLDQSTVGQLKRIIDKNPDAIIGILTKNGSLSEEWNKLLSDADLIKPDGTMPNIKLFTPSNIQGSEVDYFIFDAELTTKFDKLRDNLKAFYTYMSRSKQATIIVDSESILENDYKITNGKPDSYSLTFDPLTPEVIKRTKEQRISDLKVLLGENPSASKYDNFKWKVGGQTTDETILSSRYVLDSDKSLEPTDGVIGSKDQNKSEKEGTETEEFKILLHSFYNNPGAIINEDGTITTNSNHAPFDLNFANDIDDPEHAKKIVKSWRTLKNKLLFNMGDKKILSSEAPEYLKELFVELKGGSTELLNTEYVITVSRYDDSINTPYKKKGFISEKTLKNSELFINLSAKITLGQKTHYVTLATFGTQAQINNKALSMGIDIESINNKFKELNDALTQDKKMLELEIDDLNNIQLLTSTLLAKIYRNSKGEVDESGKREEYSLDTLEEDFPGLNYSEIRFYPGNIDAFKNLFRRYTFGKTRDEDTERWTEEKWNNEFTRLKNKPYIVVSYDSDLNGSATGTRTQALLVPVGSHKRSTSEVIKEVEFILNERTKEIHNDVLNNKEPVISDEMNAKTETLLNRSDIMDVLIIWGTTKSGNTQNPDETLLDLLTKEITFSINDQVTGNKTSVFEIFSRFKTNTKPKTNENFMKVINKIKDQIKQYKGDPKALSKEVKKQVIHDLEGTQFWHWSFFNIFGYKKIIKESQEKEFLNLLMKGIFNEDNIEAFNKSDGAKEMVNVLDKLMKAISKHQFYYSIPIKPGANKGEIKANSFISGENGFKKDTFGDKFFINVAPESPKLLYNLKSFTSSKISGEKLPEQALSPEVKKAEEKKEKKEKKEEKIKNPTGELDMESTRAVILHSLNDTEDATQEILDKTSEIITVLFSRTTPDILQELKDLVSNEDFSDFDITNKISRILERLGIVIGERGVTPQSIQAALKADKTEMDLIKEMKKKINDLLDLCK